MERGKGVGAKAEKYWDSIPRGWGGGGVKAKHLISGFLLYCSIYRCVGVDLFFQKKTRKKTVRSIEFSSRKIFLHRKSPFDWWPKEVRPVNPIYIVQYIVYTIHVLYTIARIFYHHFVGKIESNRQNGGICRKIKIVEYFPW